MNQLPLLYFNKERLKEMKIMYMHSEYHVNNIIRNLVFLQNLKSSYVI